MRAVLTLACLAVVALIASGSAAAASGTPKDPLVRYGYHLYGQYCLGCHGPNARGRFKASSSATGADPGRTQGQQGGIGPSLQGVGALAADFYLRTGYMPLRRVGLQPRRRPVFLAERQIRALTAYIASFGGAPIPQPKPELGSVSQGLALFTEHCAGCHQVLAQGGFVTGALPPALVEATPLQVAEAVRIGPYVMPKFSQRSITDRQLDSIVRYVEFAKDPHRPGGWGLGYLGPVPEGMVTWFIAIPALLVLCLLLGRRLRS
ncbi:MAG TPA: c-type cytochrome [Gaiellaceae bacterium]|nr:c-type cytochrome [Gaiellaceae bacterium]